VLAVTSRKRVGIAADIAPVAEAGYPYLGLDSLIGMNGPRGMSNALRESIAADVRADAPLVDDVESFLYAGCCALGRERPRCRCAADWQS
jgi:hypothetical protein